LNQQVDDRWLLQNRRGFALMLIISFCVAAAAFAGPTIDDLYFNGSHATPQLEPLFLMVLPAFWGILVLIALFRYRLRALWFLFGAPLVLWWPSIFVLLVLACKHGDCL
jgi:hypothetical protein